MSNEPDKKQDNEADEEQDLSKSRTVQIVNGSALPRAVIKAALSTQKLGHKPTKLPYPQSTSGSDHYVGKTIEEKYKILALLGKGGMGAVYLAHHLRLNKDVALKMFNGRNLTDDNWQRFKREAQSIGKLQHKNIVQVFDFGTADGGAPYYTMEVLDGENVSERIERKGPLDINEAMAIFLELCEGLSVCHQRKIVHRDIKPANIFLELKSSTSDAIERIKLVDFGIASLVDESNEAQRLTTAGTVFGSPLYMSPEQGMGLKVDARSDIYSCGCTLFEMLTGVPPYLAPNAFATMLCHQQATVPTLAAADPESESTNTYPEWLEALVASMLAKDPATRVQTLKEVIDVINYNWHDRSAPVASSRNSTNTGSKKVSMDSSSTESSGELSTTVEKHLARTKALLAGGAVVTLAICSLGFALTDPNLLGNKSKAPRKLADAIELSTPQIQETPVTTDEGTKPLPTNSEIPNARKIAAYRQPDRGDGKIHFHFPSTAIGMIGNESESHGQRAQGNVTITPGKNVYFQAMQPILDNPTLLDGFGKDDLHTLILDQGDLTSGWNRNTTMHMRHLKSLRKISAPISDFPKETIADLNELPLLDDLVIDGTSMSGSDMAELKRLPDLQRLSISGMKKCSPVFEVLAKRNNMVHLTAEDCWLNDDDMLNIGKLTKIEQLELAGNAITNKNLSALLNLPNLKKLSLSSNNITPEALPVLMKLRRGNTMYFPQRFWTPATKAAMCKRFGAVNLGQNRKDEEQKK